MRYTVVKSVVRMIGPIWQPGFICAQEKVLSQYDVDNIKGYGDAIGHPGINRASVEHWLALNSGDFSGITDFEASIEDGNESFEIAWADEDSEWAYSDRMYPADEEDSE